MAIEKAEWVVRYLTGKEARLIDLKDFFKIQNDEKNIRVKKTNKNEYTYTLSDCKFVVNIDPIGVPTRTTVKVLEVACLAK